jgi:hypothetical protein
MTPLSEGTAPLPQQLRDHLADLRMHELPLEEDRRELAQQVFPFGQHLVQMGGGVRFIPGEGAAGLRKSRGPGGG